MRPKAVLVALGALLAIAWSAAPAAAAPCGLPDSKPLWIDYAEGSVPFRNEVFGKPGVIAATSGTATPQALRERGARTVYWQMNIRNIVGRPLAPADPFSIEGQANALFDRAAASSACATPLIGLEELWGANLRTPWSSTNAQYRANVLTLVEVLTARGARPFLFVHGRPAVGGAAGEWWRTLSDSADIVYEAYYHAAQVHALGVLIGNRRVRLNMRGVIRRFADIGVPRERLGLALGFHSAPGMLGREGLQPLPAWLDYVKWNALAAEQVAAEEGIDSIWSWGWAAFTPGGADPDKPLAACAYLWTRDPALCDAPSCLGRCVQHVARRRTAAPCAGSALRVLRDRDHDRGARSDRADHVVSRNGRHGPAHTTGPAAGASSRARDPSCGATNRRGALQRVEAGLPSCALTAWAVAGGCSRHRQRPASRSENVAREDAAV